MVTLQIVRDEKKEIGPFWGPMGVGLLFQDQHGAMYFMEDTVCG